MVISSLDAAAESELRCSENRHDEVIGACAESCSELTDTWWHAYTTQSRLLHAIGMVINNVDAAVHGLR